MTEYYRIAGINLRIIGDALPPRDPLQPFACEQNGKPDTTIILVNEPSKVKPIYAYSSRGASWARLDDGATFLSTFHDGNMIMSSALISRDWDEIELFINQAVAYSNYFIKPILEILFCNICLLHGGFVLHSSAVKWRGNGVLFSAPSGTGKSTQADLWVEHFGAEYINGDRPLLRIIDDELLVCGTAWSGLSRIFKNMQVPVTTLVFLEQYHENRIFALNRAEALKLLLPRCFLPYHDREMMARAMDNIEAIISRTDCWHLKCKPDLGAAELVKECVMKSPLFRE